MTGVCASLRGKKGCEGRTGLTPEVLSGNLHTNDPGVNMQFTAICPTAQLLWTAGTLHQNWQRLL